jgi:hypothetical protein
MEEILASLLQSAQAAAGRTRQQLVSNCRLVGEKAKPNHRKPFVLAAEGLTSGTWYPVVDKLRTTAELDPETAEVLRLSAGSEGFERRHRSSYGRDRWTPGLEDPIGISSLHSREIP